ncbi:hemerythrin family protein [Carboxylicivirga marina]|uniref:Hemerythrin family protein n=1 Tax=Carboxylicivirga marina TaxID=2800988 RepID=A0ABS1HPH0_9BACT|nr:hemerythrin family protein [Carboxylicivirga marina]MBK3519580.1 hemerythrin family protein [Carboxylicivirga marina]
MDRRINLLREEITLQHGNLLAIAENLKVSLEMYFDLDELKALANRLLTLAELHFTTEEALMHMVKYRDIAFHAKEHLNILHGLRENITCLCHDLESCNDLVNSVNDWLIDHMNRVDKEFENYYVFFINQGFLDA